MKLQDVNITIKDEMLRKYLTYYFHLTEDIEDTEFQIDIIEGAIQHDYEIGIIDREQMEKIWAALCDIVAQFYY